MRVLDLGSGAGDVTLLVAELVGPNGSVVGVDVNPDVIGSASARAEASRLQNVRFLHGDIREVELDAEFDAIVGRLVLMYSADPAETLRAALRHVRSCGIAAFHEMNVGGLGGSSPPPPLPQRRAG